MNEQPFSEEVPLASLSQLVQKVWDDYRKRIERPVTRIASFNLLVVSIGKADPELEALVQGLHQSHPARVIWVTFQPGVPWDESKASLALSSRCNGQQVCSEEILLHCGDDLARIPSVVLPLIHSGLATHLIWWKAGSLDSMLFKPLLDRSRLALWQPEGDPSDWALEYLLRIWTDPYRQEHAVYPIDWFRLRSMRQQIARAYDSGAVEVRASDPGAKMSLAHRLLSSWLSSRLIDLGGWDFRWTSGPEATSIIKPKPTQLALDSPIDASRLALDSAERDHIFKSTLQALLGAKAAR